MNQRNNKSPITSQSTPTTSRGKAMDDKNVVEASTKGVSLLIIVQVITKLFTFVLNHALIRFISPSIFGIAAYLDLIRSTILFFSREAIRLSVQRVNATQPRTKRLQEVLNLGFLSIFISIPVSIIVGYLQGYLSSNFQQHFLKLPFLNLSVLVLILLVIAELLVEPIYCVYQYELDFGKRSKFESTAMILKCTVTVACVFLSASYFEGSEFNGAAILSFMLGQLAYAGTLLILYAFSFQGFNKLNQTCLRYKLISTNGEKNYFEPQILHMFQSFFLQMIFKQILTEGDTLLISYMCTIEEQGAYAVVSNYGSIIARLLFQPLEEATRLMLTKIMSQAKKEDTLDGTGEKATSVKDKITQNTTTSGTTITNDSYMQAFTYIKMVSLFYFNLCLVILFAGVTNGPFLLKLLLGNKNNWDKTDIFSLFPQYITYIPFLAFNGVFEAFFTSLATPKDILRYSKFMTVATVLVLALSYYLILVWNLRLSGLMIANIANMSLRIIYCFFTLQKFFSKGGIKLSFGKAVSYITPSVGIMAATWLGQYWFVFRKTSFFTQDWQELLKSTIWSGILLLNLVILERQKLQHAVRRVFHLKEE